MSTYQHYESFGRDSGTEKLTINDLPAEALLYIFSFLKTPDISACFKTCKWWRDLIGESEALWKIQCLSLNESRTQVQTDRRNGCTWKETFELNYGRNGVKRLWKEGLFSNPASLRDLPDKPLCVLDRESWGEILQWELERS